MSQMRHRNRVQLPANQLAAYQSGQVADQARRDLQAQDMGGAYERANLGRGDDQFENLAELYRRDYANYVRRFVPIENELIGSYQNRGQLRDAQQQAVGDVRGGFAGSQQALDDRMRSFGLSMTPRQRQSQQRRSQFQMGLAEVDAMNRTSREFQNQDLQIMTGAARPTGLNRRIGE